MPDIPDLTDTIVDLAENPQTVTAGDRTVTEQRLGDVIEAEKHLAGKRAVDGTNASGGPRSPWNALRPARAIPPGAV